MSKSNKDRAADAKAAGNKAFSAGQFSEAISHYSEAIKNDPAEHTYYSNRAASYSGLNQHEKALADAIKCVELKGDWMKGHYRKGVALFALGRVDEAHTAFKRAHELEPDNLDVAKRLEEADTERKRMVKDARRAQAASAAAGPNRGFETEKNAGNEFYSQGKYEQAVLSYTRALDAAKQPQDRATVLANRAAANIQMKFYDKVIKETTEAIELDTSGKWPSTVKALLRRGLALEDQEKWDLALQDMRRAILIDPNARQASDAIGRLQRNIALKKKLSAEPSKK